mmetsp:Transcript_31548/g.61576  ORF Transcript_31548/g.61576 Transcript_31548/m.61576 type:complete len:279 (+) Transcript_31548:388-1224(+)
MIMPPRAPLKVITSPRSTTPKSSAHNGSLERMTFASAAVTFCCAWLCITSATAPGPMALYTSTSSPIADPRPGQSAPHAHPDLTTSTSIHRKYMPARITVFHACRGVGSRPLLTHDDSRKMYRDQHSAPMMQKISPTLMPNRPVAAPAATPTALSLADRMTTPASAIAHPTATSRPTFCPANSDTIGVSTTESCVRKLPRDASVKSRPTLSSPCDPRFQAASSAAAIQKVILDAAIGAEEPPDGGAVLVLRMVGMKHAAARIPLPKLSAAAVGGPSRL